MFFFVFSQLVMTNYSESLDGKMFHFMHKDESFSLDNGMDSTMDCLQANDIILVVLDWPRAVRVFFFFSSRNVLLKTKSLDRGVFTSYFWLIFALTKYWTNENSYPYKFIPKAKRSPPLLLSTLSFSFVDALRKHVKMI